MNLSEGCSCQIDSQLLQTPQQIRPIRMPFGGQALLAPDGSSINRLLRPKLGAERLNVDISGVAAQRYLAKMICELDGYSSGESFGDQASFQSLNPHRPSRSSPKGPESEASNGTSCDSSCDNSDQDIQSNHSEKRKRGSRDYVGKLNSHFRLKKPARRTPGALDLPA